MHIHMLDLPDFMIDEVAKFLQYIHYYKLKNIVKHIHTFSEYLLCLDAEYGKQIVDMLQTVKPQHVFIQTTLSEEDCRYFLSQTSLSSIRNAWLESILGTQWFDRYQLLNIVMRVKWLFLLTATEFCHASTTRISLYDRLKQHVQA